MGRETRSEDFTWIRLRVNAWDPHDLISVGCPDDEYDCVVEQLLGWLVDGKGAGAISEFLVAYFEEHFGMSSDRDVDLFADEIFRAWVNRGHHTVDDRHHPGQERGQ